MTEHPITRRSVLRAGALGVLAIAVPVGAIELFGGTLAAVPTWSMAQFSSLVGTTFEARGARLVLDRVTDMRGGAANRSSRECYSLTFTGPRTPVLADTQVLRHPQLGEFAMLLVAGGGADAGRSYVAIVNRL